MNKRLQIFLLIFVASLGLAQAQYISVQASDGTFSSAGQTIVRSWTSNYVVSYYVDASFMPTMDLIDGSSGTIYRAQLPTDVYIRDMYIDKATDILYFCGATTHIYTWGMFNSDGIVGYIDLNSFLLSGFGLTMKYAYVNYTGYDYNCINKLVGYDDGGISHIVAVGEYRYISGYYVNGEYFLVDCLDILSGSPIIEVAKFTPDERYYDVLLTDNFVVFMGFDRDPLVQSLCYRKTDPYNIHDPMFDNIHYYSPDYDVLSITYSTVMPEDHVATTYMSKDAVGNFTTRIRVFDIVNDLNVNSEEYYLNDKTKPDGITYIPADNSLVVMQQFYATSTLSHNSNFVFIDPFATAGYTSAMDFKQNEYFQSLTVHDASYYLAGAGAIWFMRDKTQVLTHSNSLDCPLEEDIKIDIINNIQPGQTNQPVGDIPRVYGTLGPAPFVNVLGSYIDCQD